MVALAPHPAVPRDGPAGCAAVVEVSAACTVLGLQLGVVRKKLGVVQKFNVVRTSNLTSDHAQL